MFTILVYLFLYNVIKISKLNFSTLINPIFTIFNAFKCALFAL
jgi:hypothetical protein